MKKLFTEMEKTLNNGEDVVLVSIIASSGSTPRGTGAKMLVLKNGKSFGTIGGGAVEFEAIKLAAEVHRTKESYVKGFCLAPNKIADLGMICGGEVTVYFQFFSSEDKENVKLISHIVRLFNENINSYLITLINNDKSSKIGIYDEENGFIGPDNICSGDIETIISKRGLIRNENTAYYIEPLTRKGIVYIFGGGHVSRELVPVIAHLDFRVVVYEDRKDFADIKLFPGAERTILGDMKNISSTIDVTSSDYVVILTRGHKGDYDALLQMLKTPAAYIGLIGSRTKMAATKKRLLEDGISPDSFSRIHNPIGIDIKAETPAEIAISIAGELILNRAILNGSRK